MAEPALQIVPQVQIRRFEIPDIDRHGRWILKRLLKVYPHLGEAQIVGWLRGLVYSPEFMFLYQDYAVGLAQRGQEHSLAPKPVLYERFVFAQEGHEADAVVMYGEFAKWAKHQGIDTIILAPEMSDVKPELLKDCGFGRIFTREQRFAKLT